MATFPSQVQKSYPYFDDFNELSKYYQILFKGGMPIQARELTQLQTILQHQIGLFADHIFKNATPVRGMEIAYKNDSTDSSLTMENGVFYHLKRFVLVYNTSKDSKGVVTIIDDGTFKLNLLDGTTNYGETITTKTGIKNDGTSYTWTYDPSFTGTFIEEPSSDSDYDTWFNNKNFWAGVKIVIESDTTNNDSSLLDNANDDSPNENAPGADRLNIELSLDIRPANQSYPDFVPLLKVKNGNVFDRVTIDSQYSELAEHLAKRTFETSGNYTVDDFTVAVREWRDKELLAAPSREDSYAVEISNFISYINGVRNVKLVPTKLKLDRGLEDISDSVNGKPLSMDYYDSFNVDFSGETYTTPFLVNNWFKYNDGSTDHYGIVRDIIHISGDVFTIYFEEADSAFYTSFPSDWDVVDYTVTFFNDLSASTSVATANVASDISISLNKSLIISIFNEAVDFSDLTGYTKTYAATISSAATTATLTPTPSSLNYNIVNKNPTVSSDVFVLENGSTTPIRSNFVLKVNGTTNIIQWNTAPDVPSGDYTVYYRATSTGSSNDVNIETTKLWLTETTETIAFDASIDPDQTADIMLQNYDIRTIKSVSSGGVTFKKGVDYDLLRGQTEEYFFRGAIRWFKNKNRPTSGSIFSITYDYWAHQGSSATQASGSFITPDSFYKNSGADRAYDEINTYLGSSRSSFIDFRTRNDNVESNAGTNWKYTVNNDIPVNNAVDTTKRQSRPVNNSIFYMDIKRYLPRYDSVYMDQKGNIKIMRGVPRLNPEKPVPPKNSLKLAFIYKPAYPRNLSKINVYKWKSQRYTQSDIRKIDQRLERVETFVMNNNLEKLALKEKLDPSDIKRGILVDNFSGHGIADLSNKEYTAAIDPVEGALRLPFEFDWYDIDFNLATVVGSNMKINDTTVTLDFDEEVLASNGFASTSRNVNPYEVFEQLGNLKITPESDVWVDTNNQPTSQGDFDIKNSNFSEDLDRPGYESEFNFWQNRIVGRDADNETVNKRFTLGAQSSTTDTALRGGDDPTLRGDDNENTIRNSSNAWSAQLIKKTRQGDQAMKQEDPQLTVANDAARDLLDVKDGTVIYNKNDGGASKLEVKIDGVWVTK